MSFALTSDEILPRYICECHNISDYYQDLLAKHPNNDDPFIPVELIGAEVECLNGCEQNGCNMSDCVHCAQIYQQCSECGGPARVRITETPVRYAS